jgi:1,4-alpha-glucan branching enzyme
VTLRGATGYYGGADQGNLGGVDAEGIAWHGQPFSAELTLPPLAALWLVPDTGGDEPG